VKISEQHWFGASILTRCSMALSGTFTPSCINSTHYTDQQTFT